MPTWQDSSKKNDDQSRFVTPKKAIKLGADLLVIGRPITNSDDPLNTLKTINRSLDNNVTKMVDANSCYNPEQAIEIGKLLEDNNITHFEEPCPYWKPEQTKIVTDTLKIDVTGGEQDFDLRIWKDMVKRIIVNIFHPDVM